MIIAHYAPDLWFNGGVGTYVRRLATEQVARGHEVLLLSNTIPPADSIDSGWTPFLESRIEVEQSDRVYDVALAHRADLLHLHKPIASRPPPELPTLRTMHDNTAACPSGSRYLAGPDMPCPYTASLSTCLWGHAAHGCGSRRPTRIYENFQRMQDERHVLSDLPVVAVSDYVRDEMLRAGYAADRITVIHSPAPVHPDPPPLPMGSVPRFLFMGRIVPEKGLPWLLQALATVSAPLHLDVAGDGYALPDARALCRQLGLADRVTFHGWLDSRSIQTVLADSCAVVVPSVWHEPAGLVSLEAAAAGRPVIASQVGGIPEYATPDYALLVPPNDIPALASALTTLATDRSYAARLGARGRTAAREQFSMSRFANRYDDVYRAVVSSPTASLPSLPTPSPA